MALDLSKIREEADQTGKDLTKPSTGGGDYAPPAEGPTRLRLTGYVEYGVHTTQYQGNPKVKPRSELTFELSGPKHEPRTTDDGTKIPQRVSIKEVVGTHAKNGYIKLFNILNHDGTAKNFLGLLMEKAWRGTITHRKFTGRDGKERVAANLKKDGAYQIFPVTFEDPESGETRTVSVPPAVGQLRVFLWESPDLDQWDSLLDYQKDLIRSADNFTGSPIYNLLIESGREGELAMSKQDGEQAEAAEDEGDEAGDKPQALSEPVAEKAPAKAPAAPKAAPKAPAKPKAAPAAAKGASDPLAGL
jgi:hypothetical protein